MNNVEFVKILNEINDEVIKKETIINGWRATGLQPFVYSSHQIASMILRERVLIRQKRLVL